MSARLAVVLAAAAAVLGLAASCGSEPRCCSRRLNIPTGVAYRASLGSPDGGASTEATFTVWPDGGATAVFTRDGRRVEVQVAVEHSFF